QCGCKVSLRLMVAEVILLFPVSPILHQPLNPGFGFRCKLLIGSVSFLTELRYPLAAHFVPSLHNHSDFWCCIDPSLAIKAEKYSSLSNSSLPSWSMPSKRSSRSISENR